MARVTCNICGGQHPSWDCKARPAAIPSSAPAGHGPARKSRDSGKPGVSRTPRGDQSIKAAVAKVSSMTPEEVAAASKEAKAKVRSAKQAAKASKSPKVDIAPPPKVKAPRKPPRESGPSAVAAARAVGAPPETTKPAARRGRPSTGFDKKAHDREKARERRAAKKGSIE